MNDVIVNAVGFLSVCVVAFYAARYVSGKVTVWVIRRLDPHGEVFDPEVMGGWTREEAERYVRSPMHRKRCSCGRYGQLANVTAIVEDTSGEPFLHTAERCIPKREYLSDKATDARCSCGQMILPVGCEYRVAWNRGASVAVRHSRTCCLDGVPEDEDDDEWDGWH